MEKEKGTEHNSVDINHLIKAKNIMSLWYLKKYYCLRCASSVNITIPDYKWFGTSSLRKFLQRKFK